MIIRRRAANILPSAPSGGYDYPTGDLIVFWQASDTNYYIARLNPATLAEVSVNLVTGVLAGSIREHGNSKPFTHGNVFYVPVETSPYARYYGFNVDTGAYVDTKTLPLCSKMSDGIHETSTHVWYPTDAAPQRLVKYDKTLNTITTASTLGGYTFSEDYCVYYHEPAGTHLVVDNSPNNHAMRVVNFDTGVASADYYDVFNALTISSFPWHPGSMNKNGKFCFSRGEISGLDMVTLTAVGASNCDLDFHLTSTQIQSVFGLTGIPNCYGSATDGTNFVLLNDNESASSDGVLLMDELGGMVASAGDLGGTGKYLQGIDSSAAFLWA